MTVTPPAAAATIPSMEPTPVAERLHTVKCGCGYTLTGNDPEQLAEAERKHSCFEPRETYVASPWHISLFGNLFQIPVVVAVCVTLIVIFAGPEILQ